MDRPGALNRVRSAVRDFAAAYLPDADRWCVALSGGPDSLALTAAAAGVRPTTALIVDHGLQPGSDRVARTAADQAMKLGCVGAQVISVKVGTVGGPEGAARTARYGALDEARAGAPVLIGHTLDDQAETVLLRLLRGAGIGLGGLLPAIVFAINTATGSIYAGLWFPTIVTAIAALVTRAEPLGFSR